MVQVIMEINFEPLIGGFCRSFGMDVRCTYVEIIEVICV